MTTLRKDDFVVALIGKEQRVLRVQTVTSALVQCYWTDRQVRHYVTCAASSLRRVERDWAGTKQAGPLLTNA